MPNRILKDSICTSPTIDVLSVAAEIFFYRLLVQCDDYGCMDARVPLLRAKCYPLRLDIVTDADIVEYLGECVSAGLVWIYQSEGNPYLKVTKWDRHQQIRAQRRKYPTPPVPAGQTVNTISPEINGNQEKSGRDDGKSSVHELISDAPVIQSNPIQSESESESNPKGRGKTATGASAPTEISSADEEVDPLTTGQRFFLKSFGAKRFKNAIQRDAVLDLEKKHGTEKLTQGVNWAAKQGLGLGQAITSLETALPKWSTNANSQRTHPNGQSTAAAKRRGTGVHAARNTGRVDPDLPAEYVPRLSGNRPRPSGG